MSTERCFIPTTSGTVSSPPFQGSYGWICPVCKSVYAPWVAKCEHCGPRNYTFTTGTYPAATISYPTGCKEPGVKNE